MSKQFFHEMCDLAKINKNCLISPFVINLVNKVLIMIFKILFVLLKLHCFNKVKLSYWSKVVENVKLVLKFKLLLK